MRGWVEMATPLAPKDVVVRRLDATMRKMVDAAAADDADAAALASEIREADTAAKAVAAETLSRWVEGLALFLAQYAESSEVLAAARGL